jgi:hypothetical protein
MRNIIFVAIALSVSIAAQAAPSKKSTKKTKLTQEAVFDGSVVHGKYQMAGGAVAAVENEKTLNDIIGGRRDFKDRLRQDLGNN